MIIIWRWWYVFGIAGLALTIWASAETRHAAASTSVPVDVAASALQRGDEAEQPFVRIGSHVALYDHAVGWGPEIGDRLDWAVYPIVSADHPYLEAWRELERRYADLDDVPDDEVPVLAGAHLFVRTERWRTVDAMLPGFEQVESVEGLLFDYSGCSRDERSVLREIQSELDKSRLRLLEEGRRPRPLWLCVALGVLGVSLLVLAVRSFMKWSAAHQEARRVERAALAREEALAARAPGEPPPLP